jgi:hypothetical protein
VATNSQDMVRDMQLRELRDRVVNLENAVLLLTSYARDREGYHTLERVLDRIRKALDGG